MPLISLQELLLVVPAIVFILVYHWYLYRKVKKYPLTTAIGITNHARHMWLFVPIWIVAGSTIIIAVLYKLDQEA